MADILIVGGGPAGSACAGLLAANHDVTVLETHPESGTPLECTGLISPDVIDYCPVKPTVLNSFSKAEFHFPDDSILDIDCGRPTALLIDRSELDRNLAEYAMAAGAEFRYSEKCTASYVRNGTCKAITDKGNTYSSKVLIGADGHSSRVRRSVCGFVPSMTVRGIQADIRYEMDVQDTIRIYMGSGIAPGFFAWVIPFGEYTRLGLCCEWSYGTPSQYLNPFMKGLGLDDREIVSRSAGKIPLGYLKRTYADNVLLIGDSACQVKPISGGGLYPIFRAAPCLADTVEKAFEHDDFSANSLSSYQTAWKSLLGKEIKRGYKLRSMYNKLSDKDLNNIRRIVDKPFIREIALGADIDRPSEVCVKALRHPLVMMRLLPYLFKGVF